QSVRGKSLETALRLHIPEWHDEAVRGAVQQEKGDLFLATPYSTKLEDVSTYYYHAAPAELARLGFAVADELDKASPSVSGLAGDVHASAVRIALALKMAHNPLVVSGTSCGSEKLIEAAANVSKALCKAGSSAKLCFTVPECNSLGTALMGGRSINDAFTAVQDGEADTVIILENDLYRRAERREVDAFFDRARHVMAIDHCRTETVTRADVVLPAAVFAETGGTLVNNEGRAQRFYRVYVPQGSIQESWRRLKEMMLAVRPGVENWDSLDDVTRALENAIPGFGGIASSAPLAEFRVTGQKIPRQPHRYSGRTAMHADISIQEPKPPDDSDSPLAFSMEGYEGQPPPALITRFWFPGWNSVQAVNKFQSEVGGHLRGGDPGQHLLEPEQRSTKSYFSAAPDAFVARKDELMFVRVNHIFGSEELSSMSASIAERMPSPYIGLAPEDAEILHIRAGEELGLVLNGVEYYLPVRFLPGLAAGLGAIPDGLRGLEGVILPAWGKIRKVRRET